jgi:hypothetical protein
MKDKYAVRLSLPLRAPNLLFVAPTINQKEHKKGICSLCLQQSTKKNTKKGSRHLVAQVADDGGVRCPLVPLPHPPQTGQGLINLSSTL